MNNIFESTKFGDKFLTRDGKVAIYHYNNGNIMNQHKLIIENGYGITCKPDGSEVGYKESDNDIVSKCQEFVDEEKLDLLASSYAFSLGFATTKKIKDAYKAGYHMTMER